MKSNRTTGLGAELRSARLANGLTQAALAKRAGLCRASVVQLEAGRGRLATMMVLAAVLGLAVSADGLIAEGVSIGAVLAALRRDRGCSPLAVAGMAGLRVQTVTGVESGAAGALVEVTERLSDALGRRLRLVLLHCRQNKPESMKGEVS